MPVTKDDVLAALGKVAGPDGAPLPKTGTLSEIVASDGKVFFSISVDAAAVQGWEPVRKRAEEAVKAVPGVQSVMVALTAERKGGAGRAASGACCASGSAGRPQHGHGGGPTGVPGVAAIIAVASGKGGVGKSTTAINLALGLRDLGLSVGVLDADIYGPSLPKLLAIREKPQTIAARGSNRLPATASRHVDRLPDRGRDADDLARADGDVGAHSNAARGRVGHARHYGGRHAPGTGDAQLTMAQQVPLKGAVIVSTPQDLALIDARGAASPCSCASTCRCLASSRT